MHHSMTIITSCQDGYEPLCSEKKQDIALTVSAGSSEQNSQRSEYATLLVYDLISLSIRIDSVGRDTKTSIRTLITDKIIRSTPTIRDLYELLWSRLGLSDNEPKMKAGEAQYTLQYTIWNNFDHTYQNAVSTSTNLRYELFRFYEEAWYVSDSR